MPFAGNACLRRFAGFPGPGVAVACTGPRHAAAFAARPARIAGYGEGGCGSLSSGAIISSTDCDVRDSITNGS